MPLGDTIEITTPMNTLSPLPGKPTINGAPAAGVEPSDTRGAGGGLPTPEQTPDPEPAIEPHTNELNTTEETSLSSDIDSIDTDRAPQASDIDTIAFDDGSEQRNANKDPDTVNDTVTVVTAAEDAADLEMQSSSMHLPRERKKGERDPIYTQYILPKGAKRERKPRRQAYSAACEKAKQGSLDAYYSAFSVQGSMPLERLH